MFLWLLLGEYGLNFSHTWHDISRERDGRMKVKSGSPSSSEDKEVLPHRKEISKQSSMMVVDFGIWCVKQGSHGVTKSLITKANNVVTWEYIYVDGVFQGEYASLHFADLCEEFLMGGLIHGPHFHPTHNSW